MNLEFQSAGRIIGWLKLIATSKKPLTHQFQSAGRIIGWLKHGLPFCGGMFARVSIRRADYWLVEVAVVFVAPLGLSRFNPPGGLLVG